MIEIILYFYTFFGFLLIIFSRKIANILYNLILYYTNKLKLNDLFIFKVNSKNRNSMFFLTRSFTFLFGVFIVVFSIYILL